jgi:hypothetical protein
VDYQQETKLSDNNDYSKVGSSETIHGALKKTKNKKQKTKNKKQKLKK